MTEWRPDILGEGFECTDLDLGEDDEGPLVATLVRALPKRASLWDRLLGRRAPLEDVDVLYVHGWSDYFFQTGLARFWTDRGASFYALDLRKYGRSIREGQTPGFIENLDDYDAEIELALRAMGVDAEHFAGVETPLQGPDVTTDPETVLDGERAAHQAPRREHEPTRAGGWMPGAAAGDRIAVPLASRARSRRLVLFGHSTGGLILSLWANRHPGAADAVLLNSPWLEFQLSGTIRHLVTPLLDLGARVFPRDTGGQFDYGYYSRAQQEVADPDDPYEVNTDWRPDHAQPVTVGWLRAILAGHARVERGLAIDAPVCVLLSARTGVPLRWNEELTRSDSVLEVENIARAALRLGPSVTVERIDGALHDVFLSRRESRAEAYARLARWVKGWDALGSKPWI